MHRPLSSGPYAAHRHTRRAPVLNVCHFQHDNPGGREPSGHRYCSRMVPHRQAGRILLGMQQCRRHSCDELRSAELRSGTYGSCAQLRKAQPEDVHGRNAAVQRRPFRPRQVRAAGIHRRCRGPYPDLADDALHGASVLHLDVHRNNFRSSSRHRRRNSPSNNNRCWSVPAEDSMDSHRVQRPPNHAQRMPRVSHILDSDGHSVLLLLPQGKVAVPHSTITERCIL